MKKSSILCGIIIGMGLFLTGCANSFDHMPDLTEEQSALIAEYAAGILLKHDKNAGRLASDAEIAAADEREATLRANTEQFRAAEAAGETEEGTESEAEGGSADPDAAAPAEPVFENIAQFCGADGFRIEYTGYLVCDSYPLEDSGDIVFAMDATEGNKLLVLQFMAENTTAEDKELNILDEGIRFRISVNDEASVNCLPTLLLDDLSTFDAIVPAGSSVQAVLTREVTAQEAEAINTISLSMRNVSGNATTLLE